MSSFFDLDEDRPLGLPSPRLDLIDLAAAVLLSLCWSILGIALMSPVDRLSWFLRMEPIGGGVALGIGTAGLIVWLRRRSVPALALEATSWAMLAAILPLAFGLGLVRATLGDVMLLCGALGSFAVSFNLGWRLTPLIAAGRFGSVAAVAFALIDLLSNLGFLTL